MTTIQCPDCKKTIKINISTIDNLKKRIRQLEKEVKTLDAFSSIFK